MGSFISVIIILLIVFSVTKKKKKPGKVVKGQPRPYQPYAGRENYMPNQQGAGNPQQMGNPSGGIPAHMKDVMKKTVVNRQPGPKETSGNVILDRVLKEEARPDENEWNEDDTVKLDTIGLGMPEAELSPCMKEVQRLIVTGYTVKMPEQRDFLMEGLKLLDQHVS